MFKAAAGASGMEMMLKSLGLGEALDGLKEIAQNGTIEKIVAFSEGLEGLNARLERIEAILVRVFDEAAESDARTPAGFGGDPDDVGHGCIAIADPGPADGGPLATAGGLGEGASEEHPAPRQSRARRAATRAGDDDAGGRDGQAGEPGDQPGEGDPCTQLAD